MTGTLDTTALESAIRKALDYGSDATVKPADARASQAKLITIAIDAFVRSGTVNVTVETAGSATSQTGTGTGTVS